MNNFNLEQQFPPEITSGIAGRARSLRKAQGLTQAELSKRADVSLGSLRRFESQHEVSLKSLTKIAIALGCEADFAQLFARKHYNSIDEVINERK